MLELIGKAQALDTQALVPYVFTGTTLTGTNGFVPALLDWVLVVAGIIAVFYLIYGGILYITAGGDAEKATKGRTAVINAIIGIAVILLALAIVQWVNTLISTDTV